MLIRMYLFIFLGLILQVALAITSREFGVSDGPSKTNCSCGWVNRNSNNLPKERTEINEYPMIAGLVVKHNLELFCGGAIITKKHVLTAAHCVQGLTPINIGVHVGSNSYERVKWHHQMVDIQRFNIHPRWSKQNMVYDIAIVTLKNDLSLNKNIGPACLPTIRHNLDNQNAKLLVWGKKSNELTQINIKILNHWFCHANNKLIEKKDRHQLCTFIKGTDTCQTSASPLLWRDPKTNRFVVVGVTSYGTNCAEFPAVNTEVAYFLPWIQRTITETSDGVQTCGR